MRENAIRVRVPGTTANLGPGFDCLAMALDLWNEISVEVGPSGGEGRGFLADTVVTVEGRGARELPADGANLVYRAMERAFQLAGREVPSLRLSCVNEIPLRRGLGSSAAAIVGGLVAANLLLSRSDAPADAPLSRGEFLDLAASMEGHPDNVAAALLGGLQLMTREEGSMLSVTVPVPADVHAVLYVPEMTIATDAARAVLPDSVSREDAVYNMGRVGLFVNAMATGSLDDLRVATGDRIHQPYRQQLFPAMKVIFAGALKGGALGVFLSGSGSTILALTKGREMTVAYEMAEAARQAGVAGEVKITKPTPVGAHQVGDGADVGGVVDDPAAGP